MVDLVVVSCDGVDLNEPVVVGGNPDDECGRCPVGVGLGPEKFGGGGGPWRL